MSTGRKILVLESDAAAAFPLGAALRRNGWLVICAADAVMAFTVARKQQPPEAGATVELQFASPEEDS